MRGVLQYPGARDVHVRAATRLVGKDHADLLCDRAILRLVGLHQAHVVVGVGNRNLALTRRDRLQLVGIAALGAAREVGDDALGPRFGLRGADARDHRTHERQVVHVRARPDADLALPFRIREILVVANRRGVDRALEVEDGPGANGEREPEALGMAQFPRDSLQEHFRTHRLEEAELLCPPQPPCVDRHEDIGGAARGLVLEPLEQRILVGLDAIDLDARLLREVGVKGLVGLVMTRGIEVEDLVLGRGGQDGQEGCRTSRARRFHGVLHVGLPCIIRNDSHLSMAVKV